MTIPIEATKITPKFYEVESSLRREMFFNDEKWEDLISIEISKEDMKKEIFDLDVLTVLAVSKNRIYFADGDVEAGSYCVKSLPKYQSQKE